MRCIHCGKIIVDDAVFCPYCGKTQDNRSNTENASNSPGINQSNAASTNPLSGKHGYISRSLNPDETLIMQVKPHVLFVFHWILLAILCVLIGIVIMILADITGIVLLILGIIFAIVAYIKINTTELGFTDKRVIGKTGFIRTTSLDSPLAKINDVTISSGLIGKIFGFGNLLISTSSSKFDFKGISHAKEFRTALMNQLCNYEDNKINRQASANADAMEDLMRRMRNMQ